MTNFLLVMHHSRIYFVLKVDDYFSACDALFQIMLSQDRRHGVKSLSNDIDKMLCYERVCPRATVGNHLLFFVSLRTLRDRLTTGLSFYSPLWYFQKNFRPTRRRVFNRKGVYKPTKQTEDKSKQSAWFYCTCIEYSGQAKLIIFSKCPNLIGEFVKFFSLRS